MEDGKLANAFTVDVEDYFQVWALASHFPPDSWSGIPTRVEPNVDRILTLLADHRARGTFFTLGWIAERHPGLVRRIVAEGHELASHGYGHQKATEQTPAQFKADISSARSLLEDIGGVPVIGYRAPNFSIGPDNLWAIDCLLEAGYRYSSSIYPVHHDHYGVPDAPRFRHVWHNGLQEIPISTTRIGRRNLPAGGGGYFRLLPYAASRWLIREVNARDHQSAIFYCHPWEFDPGQPRVRNITARTRFRHYINLARTPGRVARLLRDFRWDRMDTVFLTAPQSTHSPELRPAAQS